MILAAMMLAIMAVPSPSNAGGAGSTRPTDEEIGSAYRAFLYRLVCPDEEHCDNVLWRQQPQVARVSQAECGQVRRRAMVRCEFLAVEQVYLGEVLHICAGWFRRNGDDWTMVSVLGHCWPREPDRPSP